MLRHFPINAVADLARQLAAPVESLLDQRLIGGRLPVTVDLLEQCVQRVLFERGVVEAADKAFHVFIEQKSHVRHCLSEALGIDRRGGGVGAYAPHGALELVIGGKPPLEEIHLGLPLPVGDVQPFLVGDVDSQEAEDRQQNQKFHALAQTETLKTKGPLRFPAPWEPLGDWDAAPQNSIARLG